MPYLSVVIPTARVGGIDLILDSLKAQTFTDFELVLVDALHAQRRAQVAEEASNRFLRVVHVKAPPTFPVNSFSAYANAGLAAASGEVVLHMVDFSAPPPDLLRAHAEFHKADMSGRLALMGPHYYKHLAVDSKFPCYKQDQLDWYVNDLANGRLDQFMISIGRMEDRDAEPHTVDGGAIAGANADPKLTRPAGAVEPAAFHAKNESVRLEHALAIGGFDEALDGGHGYQDVDYAERLGWHKGIQWILNPQLVNYIANPRNVFPFLKRNRTIAENHAIWQRSRILGYPPVNGGRELGAGSRGIPVGVKADGSLAFQGDFQEAPLQIAMIYGEFSSAIHGPFEPDGLYTRRGLTGSESSFFNLARSLAEIGHRVVAFCDCKEIYEHESGLTIVPIQGLTSLAQIELDAAIAWNEPDYLRFVPEGVKRFTAQQLNDWGYCGPAWYQAANRFMGKHMDGRQWQDLAGTVVYPSESSRQHHIRDEHIAIAEFAKVIPNSVDLDLFDSPSVTRNPHRAVWCSSPDRGLHHLVSMWPEIRRRVPDAELRIFYRLKPWLDRCRDLPDEVGRRARYIEHGLSTLTRGNFGVQVVDLVPNQRMADELRAAGVLIYPCDPVRYTEGFGCSVLDAAAGGCVPVISDADALAEVHGDASAVIKGNPAKARDTWLHAIEYLMTLDPASEERRKVDAGMDTHAKKHDRHAVAEQWVKLLRGK